MVFLHFKIFFYLDRSEEKIGLIKKYLIATKQFRNYNDESQDPHYTKVNNIYFLI